MEKLEVLGYHIRINNDDKNQHIPANKIVACVKEEEGKIRKKNPHLERGELAVLVALNLAGELLGLNREYRDNIDKIQSSASDALRFIEEITPSTTA